MLIPLIPSAANKATLTAASGVHLSSDYESVVTDIEDESPLGDAHCQEIVKSIMEDKHDCRNEDNKTQMLQLQFNFDCTSSLDRQQRKINLLLSKGEIKVLGGEDISRPNEHDDHYHASNITRLPIQIKQISRKSSDAASARSITSDLPASPTSLASLHSLESELERSSFPGKTLPPVRMTIETDVEEVARKLESADNYKRLFTPPKAPTREESVQTVRSEAMDAECQTLRELELPNMMMEDLPGPREERSREEEGYSVKNKSLDPMKVKGFDVAVQTVESGLAADDDVTARVLLEHVGAIERENREECLFRWLITFFFAVI